MSIFRGNLKEVISRNAVFRLVSLCHRRKKIKGHPQKFTPIRNGGLCRFVVYPVGQEVLVAALLGMVVAGLHDMVKYAGCPLGINGCNSFSGAIPNLIQKSQMKRATPERADVFSPHPA